MKKLGLLIVAAALLTVAPFSVQWTQQKVGLYLDKADAQYGVYRRHYRRVYRRAYRRAYRPAFYGYGGYYGYGYPAYSYGYPYSYGYGYQPYWGIGFGLGWGRRWWW
jgi:hypothetical protein